MILAATPTPAPAASDLRLYASMTFHNALTKIKTKLKKQRNLSGCSSDSCLGTATTSFNESITQSRRTQQHAATNLLAAPQAVNNPNAYQQQQQQQPKVFLSTKDLQSPMSQRSLQSFAFERELGPAQMEPRALVYLQAYKFGEQNDSYTNYGEPDYIEDSYFYLRNYGRNYTA